MISTEPKRSVQNSTHGECGPFHWNAVALHIAAFPLKLWQKATEQRYCILLCVKSREECFRDVSLFSVLGFISIGVI